MLQDTQLKQRVEKQHEKQKYHVTERLSLLLDKGSFREIGAHITDTYRTGVAYDGVVTGRGTIHGRPVFVFAQDFSVSAGTIGLIHGRKIAHTIELAIEAKCPVIGLYDSGGARISEGVEALGGCGEMLFQNTRASGVIPQISIVAGPCAGAASYSPAISDFVFMVDQIGQMYITGNKVIENVTGEVCTLQELGGSKVHATISGVAHQRFTSEKKCFAAVRRLLQVIPHSCMEGGNAPAAYTPGAPLPADLIPSDNRQPYSMHRVITSLLDEGSFVEMQEQFAPNMRIGFGKLCGVTVGIVANDPSHHSGCIDCDSSDKAARFVRYCDSFHIPVITLVDTPGYLPGISQEHNGIIRHGAKLLYAYSEATTIKLTVILRKAFGGGYIAMGSHHLGIDYVYVAPGATIAVMGAEGAVSILHRKELATLPPAEAEARQAELVEEYRQQYMNANQALQSGFADDILPPQELRQRLFEDIQALRYKLTGRNKGHGNIPL